MINFKRMVFGLFHNSAQRRNSIVGQASCLSPFLISALKKLETRETPVVRVQGHAAEQ
jgi:hypothetical protein